MYIYHNPIQVVQWRKFGIDGIDMDIETGAGDAAGAGAASVAFFKKIKALLLPYQTHTLNTNPRH